jgi:hypothetical protein
MKRDIHLEEESLPEKVSSPEVWGVQYKRLTLEEKEKFRTSMGAKAAVLRLYARSNAHSKYNAWSHLKALSEFVDSLIDEIEKSTASSSEK